MPANITPTRRYPCEKCPLRRLSSFRDFEPDELEFISSFKTGELVAEAGTTIFAEGAHNSHLYTVLLGWGFRSKALENGRRQILNFVLPGDLVGLQGTLLGEMQHSVEALSDMLLCVFERARLPELYKRFPSLAFDITWLSSKEEQILDEHLLSIGQRSAEARAAYLLLFIFSRAETRGMTNGGTLSLPLTQQHIADTLGLSLVHTNRVLNRLARSKIIGWRDRTMHIVNRERLADVAGWEPHSSKERPFI
jgi:CRP/FNR family transcriptional regulator, anaerobic regulatory protein